MKNVFFILSFGLFFTSCEEKVSKSEYDDLEVQYLELQDKYNNCVYQNKQLRGALNNCASKLEECQEELEQCQSDLDDCETKRILNW